MKFFVFLILAFSYREAFSQVYPTFGTPQKISIAGLTFDAMEPFISPDGNTLFFNSLNSGGNTNLYYALRVNDSLFTYVGIVNGTYDPSANHLDAVASMDSLNNFFWISLRDYPANYDNLHKGNYSTGTVSAISRVHGDFNIYVPGWLIMDGTINYNGNFLYYNNAYFNNCSFGMPCEARIGIAQKVNDSTFNKLINTDALLSNVNDTNYIVYAPQITKDGLELYFTRILKTTVNSEICVSVRSSVNDTFSLPSVLYTNLYYIPEAATLTTDKQKLYFHQKDSSGIFHIYLCYRTSSTGLPELNSENQKNIYPNPLSDNLHVQLTDPSSNFRIEVYTIQGELMYETKEKLIIDFSEFANGVYFLSFTQQNKTQFLKIIKE